MCVGKHLAPNSLMSVLIQPIGDLTEGPTLFAKVINCVVKELLVFRISGNRKFNRLNNKRKF